MDRINSKTSKNLACQKSVDKKKSRSFTDKGRELLRHRHLKYHGKEILNPFVSYHSSNEDVCNSEAIKSVNVFWKEPPDNIKCLDLISSEKLQDALLTEKSEHEVTREHISERFDKLTSELANKEDLLKTKVEIIKKVEFESIQTQKVLKDEIFELKESLLRYLPHKITFRVSIYFVSLFLFAFFADMLGVQIIEPFWNILGMSVSGGFMIMAYFLFLDWQKCNVNGAGY